MNASELRKIALEQQELEYLKHYNSTVYRIDELIELYAKWGCTRLLLHESADGYTDGNKWNFRFIDRKMFKELRKYYQKKGFRIGKTFFGNKIRIAW